MHSFGLSISSSVRIAIKSVLAFQSGLVLVLGMYFDYATRLRYYNLAIFFYWQPGAYTQTTYDKVIAVHWLSSYD